MIYTKIVITQGFVMNNFFINKKSKGFTLAEVLITLVIIGIIAALTVPTLNQSTHGEEYRSAFKKSISALNQALVMHYSIDGVGCQDYETEEDLVNKVFKQRMTIINQKNTDIFTNEELCNGAVFTIADGATFCITNWKTDPTADNQDTACNSYNTLPCAEDSTKPNIYIDINGDRNPNKLTTSGKQPKDIYTAQIYNQRVLPFGEAAQSIVYGGSRQW